jgi:hypothetical protein
MSDRAGALLTWAIFMLTIWIWMRPVLVFVAGAAVVGAVLVGVLRKLEPPGRSWRR